MFVKCFKNVKCFNVQWCKESIRQGLTDTCIQTDVRPLTVIEFARGAYY